jgi:hypothetical protein
MYLITVIPCATTALLQIISNVLTRGLAATRYLHNFNNAIVYLRHWSYFQLRAMLDLKKTVLFHHFTFKFTHL